MIPQILPEDRRTITESFLRRPEQFLIQLHIILPDCHFPEQSATEIRKPFPFNASKYVTAPQPLLPDLFDSAA
jgi:hypothetical protein